MLGTFRHDDHPWMSGPLAWDETVWRRLVEHAERDYPNECCGLLIGPRAPAERVDQVLPMANLADRYHALDPERFPRTARTYFKLDALQAARHFEQGERAGRPVKAVYHSHCDAGAYFSEEDAATFAPGGVLSWPCAFVVLSVRAGRVVDRKLWVFQDGRFVEGELRAPAPMS